MARDASTAPASPAPAGEMDEAPTRSYIKVQPTTDANTPGTIHDQFRRLHTLEIHERTTGLLGRFSERITEIPATIECLLTTTGDQNAPVGYYFGADETVMPALERILRELFPDSFELSLTDDVLPTLFEETLTDDETDAEGADDPNADPEDTPTVGALTFCGRGERPNDWQTTLAPFESFADERLPLTMVVDALAASTVPMAYQLLFQPKPSWEGEAITRKRRLREGRDTRAQRVASDWIGIGDTSEDRHLSDGEQRRLDAIDEKHTWTSFRACVRAVAVSDDEARDPTTQIERLEHAFDAVSGDDYSVVPRTETGPTASRALRRVVDREFEPTSSVRALLPGESRTRPELVADHAELPTFCVLQGENLTTETERALEITPDEQSVVTRPPEDSLARYTQGLTLGRPRTEDGRPQSASIALSPSLQPLHVAWFGKTGSGKTTSLITGMLDNHAVKDGPSILIDPKGDGMPIEYLRAHYATYGTLENVYYFDCEEVLPALSFFDIRPQLAAGVDRATAVQDVVDHYIEILMGVMGRERFERAVRSPDIIRYLVKALFDPVHGSDAFSHRDLQRAATRMAETHDAPPVSDEELEVLLGGVVTNSKRSFDELMQGVLNRIEKIPLDDRLAQLFNHVPHEDDPSFDFFDVLDENAVVIIDSSSLRSDSRRAFTLVLLSNLWSALRRRAKRAEGDDTPLVNLYLEEAAEVASSGLMTELLAKSRGFGLSVTLAMQFPAQVRSADTEAYAEILNNVSTIITGNVAVDRDLERRLATDDMPPSEVGNRLRALRRGQWFVSLPAAFGEPEPRPFVLTSALLPAGHPEGDQPLSETQQLAFEALVDAISDRTRLDHGLDRLESQSQHDTHVDSTGEPESASTETTEPTSTRVDSALPFTKRLPDCLRYNEEIHALVCTGCENRYSPTSTGMQRAIECCSSLDRVDRDSIPICDVPLTLSAAEREASDYTDRQLAFLQAVYSAHQGEYDTELEYDPCWDSMLRLREYVGTSSPELDDLIADGLLSIDCDYPHRLYTVTAAGRSEIRAPHREGVAYGHGVGDLSESTYHRVMTNLGCQLLYEQFVKNDASDAVKVIPYYQTDDGHRLDAVCVDADGNVCVTLEVERSNHDSLRAVPDDYDKMAAFEPEAAIWIVESREGAHDVLGPLNDPPTGEPRVEKSYNESTPPQVFTLDAPGCTAIHTFRYVRDSLLGLDPPS